MALDAPHHHRTKGSGYRVHVSLTVPGHELVVSHNAGADNGREDLYAAVGTAMHKALSMLRIHANRRVVHHQARSRSYRRHMRRIQLGEEGEPAPPLLHQAHSAG